MAAPLAASVLLAGCSGWSRSDDDARSKPTPTVAVGSDIDLPDDGRAGAGGTGDGSERAGAGPTSTRAEPGPGLDQGDDASTELATNQSRRIHDSGMQLTLTVDGQLRYSTEDAIRLGLEVANVGDETLRYDSNEPAWFALLDDEGQSAVWTDDSCRSAAPNAADKPIVGPAELAPGESARMLADYPAPGTTEDRDRCRVPPGVYLAVGFVSWCPDEALQRSEYNDRSWCDPERTVRVVSAPVRIEIA